MDHTNEHLRTENTEALTRTFTGTATAWAQCKRLPDFQGQAATQAVVTIQTRSGDTGASFVDINVSSEGSAVAIHQTGNGGGQYAFASGDVEVSLPLHVTVNTIPVIGSVSKEVKLLLSTQKTVAIPGGKINGSPASSPANATGTITFVGGVSVSIIPLILDAHIQIQIVGTLSEL